MKSTHKSIRAVLALLCLMMLVIAVSAADQAGLRFIAGDKGEFTFDTGLLRGKLRAGGKSAGLSSVTHVPTGARLDASMGLFSHYRLFTTNHRYGTAGWDLPSVATLVPDGSVEVHWAASADRPFALTAVYRWAAPNVLDLETRVTARTNLQHFESFLASYFSAEFTNAAVAVGEPGQIRLQPASRDAGVWLAFPRDNDAVSMIQDGRWKIEPNPVDWVIMPPLAGNLALRRSPAHNLTAVIMAPPRDAFAVLTPHQTEPHYSTYLCLFGRDLRAGESAMARSRMVLLAGPTDAEIIRLYREYTAQPGRS